MRANTKTATALLAAAGGLVMPGAGLAQECGWEGLDAEVRPYGESRRQMLVHDDGRGPALYVSAGVLTAGDERLGPIARFDGDAWSAVGDLGEVWVSALSTLDLGDGPRLYAALSDFLASTSTIHVLDGDAWVPYGPALDGVARQLVAFDDGSGPMLYASGDIDFGFDDLRVRGVARLEDGRWAGFGTVGNFYGVFGTVNDMVVFDDGDGPALYLAGDRVWPDRAPLPIEIGVARWDGAAFSVVEGSPASVVRDMLVVDDGEGQSLYVGGLMSLPSGPHGVGAARWDGDAWTALGEDFEDDALSLAFFDRGDGPALYAAGRFEEIGDYRVESIARWDGAAWRPLDEPLEGGAILIAGWDRGDLRGLYAVGGTRYIGERYIGGVPRWDGCTPCPADLDIDGALTIFDFLAFQDLFQYGDLRADFDRDGELTLFDFLAFQTAFDAGCP
ncbi:hypothetical protein AY599_21445 [Leptolyngbya valderiana BDU 20041]|nr:hypothetical protein AY599_21445 [Leptolyngbya valderiana BDU 20041]